MKGVMKKKRIASIQFYSGLVALVNAANDHLRGKPWCVSGDTDYKVMDDKLQELRALVYSVLNKLTGDE